jgi:hypothetical protein
MPDKKKPQKADIIPGSPFQSADKLYKEDRSKSENQKRFERWTDAIVKDRKLPSTWREDRDAELKAKWVDGKSDIPPFEKTGKGSKNSRSTRKV